MSTQKMIREIQNGDKSDLELEEHLQLNNVFVLSNVMKELVKRKIVNSSIELRLKEISSCRKKEHVLMGIYTIGHLSISTLIKLGFSKDDLDVYIMLDGYDKKIVDNLFNAYDEVL